MTVGIPMELLREHFTFRGRVGRLKWFFSGVVPWIGIFLFASALLQLAEIAPDHKELILKSVFIGFSNIGSSHLTRAF